VCVCVCVVFNVLDIGPHPDTCPPKITTVDVCPPHLPQHTPGSSVRDNCHRGQGGRCRGDECQITGGVTLGIHVCRDETSCHPRQLNGGCIQEYWPDRPILHLPPTATGRRSVKPDTRRGSRALVGFDVQMDHVTVAYGTYRDLPSTLSDNL